MPYTITILGSGTSTGVPQIGCGCEVCTSADPRDKRLRASALVTTPRGNRFLIDCGPDFRLQILLQGAPHLDGLLITHSHYDHVGGIDDLRPYCHPVSFPVWCEPNVARDLRNRVPYCFAKHLYPGVPTFNIHELTTLDPFEITTVATYRKICQWDESEGERLGGVVCAWHDDFARNGYEFIRNQAVMPALTLFGDALWDGREDGEETVGRWMPRAGNKALARAAAVERRTQAQRDRIWCDSPYPYQFLKQTDMRWRVTDGRTGEVLATNVAQATVFMWQACGDGVEGGKVVSSAGNIFTNRSGVAVMETWIRSPKDQEVGAWIGFTDFTRDHGRAYSAPTPDVGKWNRNDATVELNGERVAPPKWRKPGQLAGGDVPYLLYVHELDEKPFEDEEYYMREPTRIMLKKGWNHVKLTIPCKRAANHAPWVGTFIPLLGTTEHPREVPGLEYSCMPK